MSAEIIRPDISNILGNQSDDILERHADIITFLRSVILENHLRRILHRGKSGSCELVGVNDDVNAALLELFLGYGIE